jgi:hypothetical protein
MASFHHPAGSQISINVLTTTVTTTSEVARLPLSLTPSTDSEGAIKTASSTLNREAGDGKVDNVATLKQEDDVQPAYPHFPTHPYRNPHHARHISTANAPSTLFITLNSDP